ncbi:TPA: fimbrial protein [Serratia marcescens]|nr:type 1 fimbrial protein [Serratia marcescens]
MKFRIKRVKALCLLPLLVGFAQQAISAVQGQGRVNMQGAITEAACAIATESREQIINMETLPLSDIYRDGKGRTVPFSIELINCILERADKTLPDWKQFQVTFDGYAEGEMFGIEGGVSGVGLVITDAGGNRAMPGKPLPPGDLRQGNYRLDYAMTVTANNQPLKTGHYFSSVRFKMDYY